MDWKASIRNQIVVRDSKNYHWNLLVSRYQNSLNQISEVEKRVLELEDALKLATTNASSQRDKGDTIALEKKNHQLINELYQLQKDKSERMSNEVAVFKNNQELEKENKKLLSQVKCLDFEKKKYQHENRELLEKINDLKDQELVSYLEFNCLSDQKEKLLKLVKF